MSSTHEQFVYTFGLGEPATQTTSTALLGGKGASLAEMTRAGFPVPAGFTISTTCCSVVEQNAGVWPDGLDDQIRVALQKLEATTQRTYGKGPRPLFVAVRSGAAVSMPGMMDTILNCGMNPSVLDCFPTPDAFWKDYAEHIRLFSASVAGLAVAADHKLSPEARARRYLAMYKDRTGQEFPTDPWDALRQSINAVFASWHSERAKAYRQHHDVRGISGTAVNVQAMFASEKSGVLFTVNPNKPSSGEMILEASWGLGEAVVSGAVTPDIYTLDAATLKTLHVSAGSTAGLTSHDSQQAHVLSQEQQREIAELGRRVEQHFSVPSDIEWGIADGHVVLLQTRKIRGLDVIEEAEKGRLAEIERLQKLAGNEPAVWVVHNLSETLAAPTPLTWDLVRWFMSAQGGYGQMYRLLGHHPREREPGHGFLELIAGRIYVDPRRAAEFHFGSLPFEYDIDEILRDRTALDRPPTRFNFERTDSLFFFRLPGMLWNMIRGSRTMKRMSKLHAERFDRFIVPKLDEFLNEARQLNLRSLTSDALVHELSRRRDFVLGWFAGESLIPGFFGGIAHDQLCKLASQLFGQMDGEQFVGELTTGLVGDITVEQNLMLFEIARGGRDTSEFFRRYGHRAVNEMELAQPRWREDHQFVDGMIERFRSSSDVSPAERHQRQVRQREATEASLPDRLRSVGGSSLLEQFEAALKQAQRLLPYRELGKFHLMRGYESLREVLTEFSRRWELGRDLYFLNLTELPQFEANRDYLETQISTRKSRWRALQKLPMSDVIDSRSLAGFGEVRKAARTAGDLAIECRPISSGTGRGIARIVMDPDQITNLGQDYILVCPSTDPGWTPLFVNARGLIVERGGVLSHGAIVARDFGIPAVVLEGATQILTDGSILDLDANHGTIIVNDIAKTQAPQEAL